MGFDYDVFFSYRHRPLDGEITQKVFNAIESYRLPRPIREQGFEDIRRAFRDTEELPVSRILTDTIDRALHSTNCLVVVCSVDTPSSEWIDREVQTFIEIGRSSHIYPLLISGDPEHSFPPSLKLVPDVADRIMDIRVPDSNVKKMMAKADTALLRVISGITGCKETDLLREHKLRKGRRFAFRAAGAALVFALVAGVSLQLMNLARSYRDETQRQEAASMRILNELTYSLPDHLTNVPGAYGRIAGILEQNTRDINAILRLSPDDKNAEFEAAANYEKLANASSVLGEFDRALNAEDEATAIFRTLLGVNGEKAGNALASAANNRGIILNSAGRYEEADEAYDEAAGLLETQGNADSLLMAQILFNAGANAVNLGDESRADAKFEESLALLSTLEESPESLESAAKANYNLGVMLYRGGQYDTAEEKLSAAASLQERLLSQSDSLINRDNYVRTLSMLAALLTDTGDFDRADRYYELGIQAAEILAADGENAKYLRLLAELCNNRALSDNIRGRYTSADVLYGRTVELRSGILAKTGAAADRAQYALALLNQGENAFKMGEMARSRAAFEAGLGEYENALPALGDFDRSYCAAWQSYYELIHLRDYAAALNTAITAVQLQPNSVLANMNLAYACLYSGHRQDAELLLSQIAALGGGQAETIRVDLEAQQKAGLPLEDADALFALLGLSPSSAA